MLKVDFSKVFNMVDWDFLLDMIGWIKIIFNLSKTTILVNGSQYGYNRYYHSLRQGDPLPLLFFVLVTDVLSTMLSHALNSGILYGVILGDCCIMCNIKVIKLILCLFKGITGLTINYSKTCQYSIRPDQFLDTTLT